MFDQQLCLRLTDCVVQYFKMCSRQPMAYLGFEREHKVGERGGAGSRRLMGAWGIGLVIGSRRPDEQIGESGGCGSHRRLDW